MTYPCTISVIVPVLNEADLINDLIVQVRSSSMQIEPEIIIVDGAPDAGTLRAITVPGVVKVASPPGRARQMNEGARAAGGDILLFLHADTVLPPGALPLIVRIMEDKRFVGGAFDLGISSRRLVFRLIACAASLRSRLTRIPFGDQAFFVRAGYFREMGGYPDIPLMEDLEFMRRIKGRGDRIFISREKVLTSPRRWEREGIICCTARNWLLQALYYAGVSPRRLVKFYRRW